MVVVDAKCKFKIEGRSIVALKRSDEWTYLGIKFDSKGRVHSEVLGKLSVFLSRLTKAPLKLNQRLWALRVLVIPSMMYELTLSKTTYGLLRSVDKKIRKAAKEWLHLPHDCATGFFHASILDGGLGTLAEMECASRAPQ